MCLRGVAGFFERENVKTTRRKWQVCVFDAGTHTYRVLASYGAPGPAFHHAGPHDIVIPPAHHVEPITQTCRTDFCCEKCDQVL